jgi:uncharacterized protein YbcI
MSVDAPSPSVTITNELRAACKRLWGRGPENAQVLFADESTVVVMLSGVLTEAERTLLAVDRDPVVGSSRAALHAAVEPELRAILETNTGRATHAFISGVDLNRDVASFVVTLADDDPEDALSAGGARPDRVAVAGDAALTAPKSPDDPESWIIGTVESLPQQKLE